MAKTASAQKTASKKGGAKTKKEGKKLSSLYDISGSKIIRSNRFCPKCGPGTFLGKHKDRVVCGRCRYVEFVKC